MEKIELNDAHTEIVLLYLKKLDIMTNEEREVILETIKLINKPIFITEDKLKLNY